MREPALEHTASTHRFDLRTYAYSTISGHSPSQPPSTGTPVLSTARPVMIEVSRTVSNASIITIGTGSDTVLLIVDLVGGAAGHVDPT